MASPKKTLLVEQISYAEEELKHLKMQFHELFVDIENEYSKVLQELTRLEENEVSVDEGTSERVNSILQDAWIKAMSARTRFKDLDMDLHEADVVIEDCLNQLQRQQELKKQ